MTSQDPLSGDFTLLGSLRAMFRLEPNGLGRLAVVAEEIAQSVKWRCFAEEAARQLKIDMCFVMPFLPSSLAVAIKPL
jgi:hypothetical protein